MATAIIADSEDTPCRSLLVNMGSLGNNVSDPLADLPAGCEIITFSNLERLKASAKFIVDKLSENDEEGNQFLVVLGLPNSMKKRLEDDKNALEVASFRFMSHEDTGIIKLLPPVSHDYTTDFFRRKIEQECIQMGVPEQDFAWGRTTTHPGAAGNSSKQPDECFNPAPRLPSNGVLNGWPTLVIETGVSESLPRLRQDAIWWFNNSGGDVRIVIILCVRKSQKKLLVEKWQLAPPGTPNPMTRAVVNQLQQQAPPAMPPLSKQLPAMQQPYAQQEIVVTRTAVAGGPLVLPFEALFCRPPQGMEGDIVLGDQALTFCLGVL